MEISKKNGVVSYIGPIHSSSHVINLTVVETVYVFTWIQFIKVMNTATVVTNVIYNEPSLFKPQFSPVSIFDCFYDNGLYGLAKRYS